MTSFTAVTHDSQGHDYHEQLSRKDLSVLGTATTHDESLNPVSQLAHTHMWQIVGNAHSLLTTHSLLTHFSLLTHYSLLTNYSLLTTCAIATHGSHGR
jgi:hypothetical protein